MQKAYELLENDRLSSFLKFSRKAIASTVIVSFLWSDLALSMDQDEEQKHEQRHIQQQISAQALAAAAREPEETADHSSESSSPHSNEQGNQRSSSNETPDDSGSGTGAGSLNSSTEDTGDEEESSASPPAEHSAQILPSNALPQDSGSGTGAGSSNSSHENLGDAAEGNALGSTVHSAGSTPPSSPTTPPEQKSPRRSSSDEENDFKNDNIFGTEELEVSEEEGSLRKGGQAVVVAEADVPTVYETSESSVVVDDSKDASRSTPPSSPTSGTTPPGQGSPTFIPSDEETEFNKHKTFSSEDRKTSDEGSSPRPGGEAAVEKEAGGSTVFASSNTSADDVSANPNAKVVVDDGDLPPPETPPGSMTYLNGSVIQVLVGGSAAIPMNTFSIPPAKVEQFLAKVDQQALDNLKTKSPTNSDTTQDVRASKVISNGDQPLANNSSDTENSDDEADESTSLLSKFDKKGGHTGSIQERGTQSRTRDIDGKAIVYNQLRPEDFKKAWGGNHRKQREIARWVSYLRGEDPTNVATLLKALREACGGADKGKFSLSYLMNFVASLHKQKGPSHHSPPADLESTGSGGNPDLPLPASFIGSPKKSAKILHFLTHLERYTFQNQTTWLQWAGMTGLAIIGGLAAWPDVPVFTIGVGEIFYERMRLSQTNEEEIMNAVIGFVCATALVDNIPRMAWCAQRFLAPSTDEFSITPHPIRKYGLYALVCLGAVVPTVVQFFYLLDAELTFMDWAREQGYSTQPMKQMLYRWGPFYVIEGFVWSVDQLNNFRRWSNQRFLNEEIPHHLPGSVAQFRMETLKRLEALEEALYYMPDAQVRSVYNELYNPMLWLMMQKQAPEATYDHLERMMGCYRLKYILNMANDLREDVHHGKSVYQSSTEWLSMGGSFIASAGRLLGLQIVFQLLFQELSFGYISPEVAEYLGWISSGGLGLWAQGFAEVIGSVDFFNEFLWSSEPQGESALKALRIPARLYTSLESIWNLIPLVALSLDGCDKFFGGNYYWMFLFAPYIINEFTAGAVTLSESYVKNIPTTCNRGYNQIRRLLGFGNTVGYMRDESVLMVQRLHRILKHADLDSLTYIKEEIVDHHDSDSLDSEVDELLSGQEAH